MLQDIGRLLYGQPFRIPAQFALTARAVGLLISVATQLDPELDFIAAATPYARVFLRSEGARVDQLVQLRRTICKPGSGYGCSLAQDAAGGGAASLAKVESGDLALNINTALRGPVGLRRRENESVTGTAAVTPGFSWPAMFAAALAGGISSPDHDSPVSGCLVLFRAGRSLRPARLAEKLMLMVAAAPPRNDTGMPHRPFPGLGQPCSTE